MMCVKFFITCVMTQKMMQYFQFCFGGSECHHGKLKGISIIGGSLYFVH